MNDGRFEKDTAQRLSGIVEPRFHYAVHGLELFRIGAGGKDAYLIDAVLNAIREGQTNLRNEIKNLEYRAVSAEKELTAQREAKRKAKEEAEAAKNKPDEVAVVATVEENK